MISVALQALPVLTADGTGLLGGGSDVSLPYGLVVESTLLLEAVVVAAVFAVWFLLYFGLLATTRPADVDPLPANADIPGEEPPAVVSLLAGRWKLNEDAAEATLIDLAARRWIEFRQPGNDPTHTTVHVVQHPGGRPAKEQQALTEYEEMVLARVRTEAVDHVVPITALTFRDLGQAGTWTTRLHKSVIEDARARGLTRRRFSPLLVTLLSAAAAVPAALLAIVIIERTGEFGAAPVTGLICWGLLSGLAGRSLGERDTPAGREAAARWFGLQRFLRNDEAFAELPPSAVAVWDRYLSYGDALGVTRVCSALIDLGMGDRKRVWSSFGGRWHRVRVRYPTFWGRYGITVPRALIGAIGVLVAGGFLVKLFGPQGFERPDTVLAAVGDVPLALGLYLVVRGVYRLTRLAGDLIAPKTLSGEVLWIQLWRSTAERENRPAEPLVHYFAVDDGTDDRTTAWALPSDWSARTRPGDLVTITVRPWTRRVSELTVDSSRAARSAEVAAAGGPAGGAAAGDSEGATAQVPRGPLGPLEVLPGLAPVLGGEGGPPLSPALASAVVTGALASAMGAGVPTISHLLSVDEVAAALGRPMQSDARARVRLGPFELVTFSTTEGGGPVLVVAVARGSAVGLVMRGGRRSGTPLPGLGDEAFQGQGWALGRRGDTVIRLTTESRTDAPPGTLPALLAKALARL